MQTLCFVSDKYLHSLHFVLPSNSEVLIIQLQSVAVITKSRKRQKGKEHILAGIKKNLFIAKGLEVLHICLFHRRGICLLKQIKRINI